MGGRRETDSFELLEDAGVQVLVHVFVLEGILSCFLGGRRGGVEVLEMVGEAHAHFEGIRHGDDLERAEEEGRREGMLAVAGFMEL